MELNYKYTKIYNDNETAIFEVNINDMKQKWEVFKDVYPFHPQQKITKRKTFTCLHCSKQYMAKDCRFEMWVENKDIDNAEILILCPDENCSGTVIDWLWNE